MTDPKGYGQTWHPYKTLAGIEWHGGRFDRSVELYQRARDLGGTLADVGSGLADALLFAGRYREAQEVQEAVLANGANEWRDVFRSAVLFEIVDELEIDSQGRRLRKSGTTTEIEIDATSVAAASHYLRSHDALDVSSWAVLGGHIHTPSRVSHAMASAYLADSEFAWLKLMMFSMSSDNSDMQALVLDALSDSPDVVSILTSLIENLSLEGLQDVKTFLEACRREAKLRAG